MSLISWLIVFIPFIFMSVIVAVILMIFGLDPETGNTPNKGGNLVFRSAPPETQTATTIAPTTSQINYTLSSGPTGYSTDAAYESFVNITKK